MSDKNHLCFEIDEGVGIVTFNRPEQLNAITWDLANDLVQLFRDLRFEDAVHTVLLTGEGKAFSAGADAEWISGGSDRPLPGLSDLPIARYQRKSPAGPFVEFTRAIVALEKPVIAAIPGPAMGAGLAYALACDRRFGDTNARMCAAFVRLGFSPDSGVSYFLPRITNLPTALMMVETGKILDAQASKEAGLLDELVEEGKAFGAALAYAKKLAAGPSVAIDLGRRFIYKALTSSLDEMLDYEAVAGTMAAHTSDAREGTSAFIEKRKPRFTGV